MAESGTAKIATASTIHFELHSSGTFGWGAPAAQLVAIFFIWRLSTPEVSLIIPQWTEELLVSSYFFFWSTDHMHRGDHTFVVAVPNSGMSCSYKLGWPLHCMFINHVLKFSFIPWLLIPFMGCLSCSYGLCVLLCCLQHFGHLVLFLNVLYKYIWTGLDWIA